MNEKVYRDAIAADEEKVKEKAGKDVDPDSVQISFKYGSDEKVSAKKGSSKKSTGKKSTGKKSTGKKSPVKESPDKERGEELSALQIKLEEQEKEAGNFNDLYLRTRADLENYKVRANKEKAEYIRHANDKIIGEFLDILDNIERALEHSGNSGELESLRNGVQHTRDNMLTVLDTLGLKPVKAVGEAFDPKIHEAISHEEDAEREPGTVIREFKKGFFLHDRLLRPATVSVAKTPETH